MEHRNFPRRAFVTSDGVQLSYIRQGSGRPIVLIHGWSQCAEEFKHQIGPLSAHRDRQKSSESTRLGFQKPKAQSREENAKTLACNFLRTGQ
jgi:hypothetical protein